MKQCAQIAGVVLALLSRLALAQPVGPWEEGRTYRPGDEVDYGGVRYAALVSHTAYAGANWNPAQTPSLWRKLPAISSAASGNAAAAGDSACYAGWQRATAYLAGNRISYQGRNFEAKWWTRGEVPGATGQWGVWQDLAACGSSAATPTPLPTATPVPAVSPTPLASPKPAATPTAAPTLAPSSPPVMSSSCNPAWVSAVAYTGGQRVTHKGINYEAKWWSRGEEPGTTGQYGAWKTLDACSGVTVTPVVTPTRAPTLTPAATATPRPSVTPVPTVVVTPTATASPKPSATPTPTPLPTATPTLAPTVTPAPLPGGSLQISEIASDPSGAGSWFEIRNTGSSAVSLADVRARVRNNSGTVTEYALGSGSLAGGAYLVAAAATGARGQLSTSQIVYLGQSGNYPRWTSGGGAVELIRNGQTLDFVRFGASSDQPLTAAAWSGASATAIPAAYGYALVRYYTQTSDSNSAADWQSVGFSTPGGRNDVPASATDSDGDGIPSTAKVPGGTYAGLDLYGMGVRAGRPAILIQLDHMQSSDEGVIPQREALQAVVDAFARRNIDVIFDAGTLYSGTFSPVNFNLGGGRQVAFSACVDLSPPAGCAALADYKAASMDVRRRQIFHYLLMGSSRNADGSAGSSGVAEIGGNDLIVALGQWGLNSSTASNRYRLINYQAGTIMHELGHNLGLRHGGFENTNNKPNYYSIMNYLFQLRGLGDRASGIGPVQRYYANKGYYSLSTCSLEGSPCSNTFRIDYSDGSGARLNENGLRESDNIGRGADAGVYADWNNSRALNGGAYALDLNGDGSLGYLQDYDDWGNLTLHFASTSQGSTGAAAMLRSAAPAEARPRQHSRSFMHERYEHADEEAPPAEFFDELRKESPHAHRN